MCMFEILILLVWKGIIYFGMSNDILLLVLLGKAVTTCGVKDLVEKYSVREFWAEVKPILYFISKPKGRMRTAV